MNFLRQMASDGTDRASSTRIMMLATGLTILVRFAAFNGTWLIQGKGGFDFSATDLVLLGIVLAGKVAQSVAENVKV